MESTKANGRFGVVLFLTILAAVAGLACSDPESGGGAGSGGSAGSGGGAASGGTSGGENPCLQPNNPACSTATLDESGAGEIRVFFAEQRVEAASTSTATAIASKGGGSAPGSYSVSAFETEVNCNTNQPGDAFSNVECVLYSIDSFIQAELQKWFRLVFTGAESGDAAPITMRVVPRDGGGYTLEAAWGSYACDDNGGMQTCDENSTAGDGKRDSCCTLNSQCDSNRCCMSGMCLEQPDDAYTCRDPL